MMIEPPIDELVKKTHGRYALVLAVSKRARQLNDGALPLVDGTNKKAITVAVDELYKNKIEIVGEKPEK